MKPGHLSNSNEFSENAEHWLEEHVNSFFFVFKHIIPLAVLHRHNPNNGTSKTTPLSAPGSVSLTTSWCTVDRCKAGRSLALDIQFCVLENRDK